MKKIRIEDKPIWCSAWCSKISDQVMCNTIQCCGFAHHGDTEKVVDRFDKNTIGRHPLINGRFKFGDGKLKKETPR